MSYLEDYPMKEHINSVITELSKIEMTAVNILDSTENKKASLLEEKNKQKSNFYQELALESKSRIENFYEDLKAISDKDFEHKNNQAKSLIINLENAYNDKHSVWANEILKRILGE